MVEGVDCQMPCVQRTYNKYRLNKKGKYELSKLQGAAWHFPSVCQFGFLSPGRFHLAKHSFTGTP
jgi:hypothetical protein